MPDHDTHTSPEDDSTETAFPPERLPERIGPYKILEKIGEGGMGVVYLAEQEAPLRRRVALKVIKPGMDSKQVLARFDAERQALALMNHPGVAKVFDAGSTPEGRPYFVMEHVAGLAITEYCDKHLLDNRQRLKLFVEVCEAIQHAHQKGIIHRDIKPSNVLVALLDGKPQPKVIDFGVAKATQQQLTEQTLFTQQGVLIGTPEYMSPEQAEMNALDIDTRSDVYSLGVLLYELLVGELPFDPKALRQAAFREMQRIIRETDPPKPSARYSTLGDRATETARKHGTEPKALRRQLLGDLDWITMRAIEKDRTRRYPTPSELESDILCYLNSEAVAARPPSLSYKVRKLATKHKGAVASVATIVVVLLFSTVGTSLMYLKARRSERIALQQAYAAHIWGADHSLNAGDVAMAKAHLDACPSDLRGWEWSFLRRRSDQCKFALIGHSSVLNAVAVSPNGRQVLTASSDQTVRLWDAASGIQLRTFPIGGKGGIFADAVFSPDGTHIAATSLSEVRIWNALNGELIASHPTNAVLCIAFSPDGSRLAEGSRDQTVTIRDWRSGIPVAVLVVPEKGRITRNLDPNLGPVYVEDKDEPVESIAFSPDGSQLASPNRLWDVKSGKIVRHLSEGSHQPFHCVAFRPDGKEIAAGAYDGSVYLFDLPGGLSTPFLMGHSGKVNAVAYSRDGARLATASDDKTIAVWNTSSREMERSLSGHEGPVKAVAFDPGGAFLTSGSSDASARLWNLLGPPSPLPIQPFSETGGTLNMAVNPEATRLFASASNPWEPASPRMSIGIWDVRTGVRVSALTGHTKSVLSLAIAADGSRLVSGSSDQTVRIWDVVTGQCTRVLTGFGGVVRGVGWAHDGGHVVTLAEGIVRVFDASTGSLVRTLEDQGSETSALAVSRSGSLIATGSRDGVVRVWDANRAESVSMEGLSCGIICALAFSPDGSHVAIGSADSKVRIWSPAEKRVVRVLTGHSSQVYSVAFSPDGSRVVSGSADLTVRLWDAQTGDFLVAVPVKGKMISCALFTPDGARLAVRDSAIRIW